MKYSCLFLLLSLAFSLAAQQTAKDGSVDSLQTEIEDFVLNKKAASPLSELEKTVPEETSAVEPAGPSLFRRFWTVTGISLLLGILAFTLYTHFQYRKNARQIIAKKEQQIEAERDLSEKWLSHLVPAPVAREIREHKKTIAKKHAYASVLFADFENFAVLSGQLQPIQLVAELDRCFRGFDHILAQFDNIEKVKTIGDTYLCATGLTTRETLPTSLVEAALQMQDFLYEYKKEKMARGEPFFIARIGIHTGAVVAGVVGANKFTFDLWGETVDIAAAVKNQCTAGRVNVSAATYRLIKYAYAGLEWGQLLLPDGKEMKMYYVEKEVAPT